MASELRTRPSAKDTDFTVKLVDVYPVQVGLHVTANRFKTGLRIRIEVSSSNFPRFDRNLNTGGNNHDESEWVVAQNVIQKILAHLDDNATSALLPDCRASPTVGLFV